MDQDKALVVIATELDNGNQARKLLSEIIATLLLPVNEPYGSSELRGLVSQWDKRHRCITSLTEAAMGITAGLVDIASAIRELAEAVSIPPGPPNWKEE